MSTKRNRTWETLTGQRVKGSQVNNHHILFERRFYNTQTEKTCRSKTGLILPMHLPEHYGLHAAVEPPIKPSRELMVDFTDYMREEPEISPYIQFGRAMLYFADVASEDNKYSSQANQLLDNLYRQKPFIDAGYVILQEIL